MREVHNIRFRNGYSKKGNWNGAAGGADRFNYLVLMKNKLREQIDSLYREREEIGRFFEEYELNGFNGMLEPCQVEDVQHVKVLVDMFDTFYAQPN